jgi:outer membrane protein TolC
LIETNRNYGPNYGLNFTYTLFNGFTTQQKVNNARLAQLSQELQLNETVAGIQSELYKLYTNYTTYTKIMELEDSNVRNARQNTKVAFEKYRLGELNDLDFRQIQLKQVAAENQLVQAQYQLKLIETELLRISGRLVNEAVVK